jgi:hypothetical protein
MSITSSRRSQLPRTTPRADLREPIGRCVYFESAAGC